LPLPLVIQHLLLPPCHVPTLCVFSPLSLVGQHLLLLCVLLPGHACVLLPPPFVAQRLLVLVLVLCVPPPSLCSQSRLFTLGLLVPCTFCCPVVVRCDTFLRVHFTPHVGIERGMCVCFVSRHEAVRVRLGIRTHHMFPLPARPPVSIVCIGKPGDGEGGSGGRVGVLLWHEGPSARLVQLAGNE
jgi:hypothetical protein